MERAQFLGPAIKVDRSPKKRHPIWGQLLVSFLGESMINDQWLVGGDWNHGILWLSIQLGIIIIPTYHWSWDDSPASQNGRNKNPKNQTSFGLVKNGGYSTSHVFFWMGKGFSEPFFKMLFPTFGRQAVESLVNPNTAPSYSLSF